MGKAILWLVVLVLIVGGFILYGSRGGSATKEPIKIGFIGPLTGDLANVGQNAKAAVEIAVEEVNVAGGINGRPVEVIYEDDTCAGPEGVTAATKLVNVDKVSAILGSACSPAMLAFAPIAETAKIPTLGYCATAPTISQAGDYIFRNVPSDLFQAKFAAEHLFNTMGKKTASILYINNDWGVGLHQAFSEAFTALGGKIVSDEAYDPTSKDLRTQLSKVKAAKADVLYFAGPTDNTVVGLKQAKEAKLTQTIFGADAWDDNKIWEGLGVAGDGAMFTVVGTNSSDAFKAKMKEKVGNDSIVYCSNYAYDGIKILSQALSDVGTDGTALKDALYKASYTGGVSSTKVEFDQNGDPKESSYVIKVVKDGKADIMK